MCGGGGGVSITQKKCVTLSRVRVCWVGSTRTLIVLRHFTHHPCGTYLKGGSGLRRYCNTHPSSKVLRITPPIQPTVVVWVGCEGIIPKRYPASGGSGLRCHTQATRNFENFGIFSPPTPYYPQILWVGSEVSYPRHIFSTTRHRQGIVRIYIQYTSVLSRKVTQRSMRH